MPSWVLLVLALMMASAICDAMIVARVLRTEEVKHAFMPGNLILAWFPLIFAIGVRASVRLPSGIGVPSALACCGLWLLFLPNAPYMVTDIMHYRVTSELPVWYDAIMLGSFAMTGVMLGALSLYLMHELAERLGGVILGWLFAASSIAASGVGIYFGRVLRWNSWDAVRSPSLVVEDAMVLVRHPVEYQAAWALIILSSAFFWSAYVVLWGATRLEFNNDIRRSPMRDVRR
jgi:uncharacterized membrane protein